MQDVIFNGSGNRKPASRASVELVFSNEDARAGGQWNQFAEIAVKRVLTRDGTSSYFINNQPVRRRDVQDVFLGTGLGPRAYAIIGQGTISRIIESGPKNCACSWKRPRGVQVQGAPPRDGNRLKDTRENLTRVDDILRELNNNLDKLEKQAEVATRYRSLQEQGTLKLHQLWFLKHRDAARKRRVKAGSGRGRPPRWKPAWPNCATSRPNWRRCARRTTPPATRCIQAGELAEAALAVSRLEERIRYVVEGRQRRATPGRPAGAERAVGPAPGRGRGRAGRHRRADRGRRRAGRVLAAQAEEQADGAAQAWKTPCAAPSAPTAARRGGQVQQQIQLLAADSRNIDDQSRQFTPAASACRTERQGLQARPMRPG
jgi:chromosome segregation protein